MMRKFISISIVFAMLIGMAVSVSAANTVLVDESFSSYTGGNTVSGWTVTAGASRMTAYSGNYGTSVRVATTASGEIMTKTFTAQTSGQLLLTADVMVSTNSAAVVYLANANSTQRTSVSIKNPDKVGQWTKVNVLLDIEGNVIQRWFDNDYEGATTSDFTITSCSKLFFANWDPVDSSGYIIIDNVKVIKIPQSFSVESSAIHSSSYDIFSYGGDKSYKFTYKNSDSESRSISVLLTAKDGTGATIKTQTFNQTVFAGKTYSRTFTFDYSTRTEGTVFVELTVGGVVSYCRTYKFICMNTKADEGLYSDTGGINTHLGQGRSAANTVPMIKATGVSTIRDGVEWWRCETTEGTISVPSFADTMINDTYEAGEKILFILSYGNALYSSNEKDIPTTTAYINKWLDYVTYIVTRYRDKVDYWQVWNEPNISAFNTNGATAAQYTELLRQTYNKIKSLDPTSKVVGGGLAGAGNSDTRVYLRSMLSAGAGSYMDILDIHPYDQDNTPEGYMAARLPNIQTDLETYGYGRIPIWVGELGWYTGTGADYVSEETQAAYAVRSRILYDKFNLDNSKSGKMFWYDLQNDGTTASYGEHNYGLTNNNFSPKPAFYAYTAFNSIIGNKLLKSVASSSGIYQAQYGNDTYVLWKSSGTGSKAVTLTGDKARIYNMYGDLTDEISISRGGYSYTASVSGNPVFIVVEKYNSFDITDVTVDGDTLSIEGYAYPDADISVSLWSENALPANITSDNAFDYFSGIKQVIADESGYFTAEMSVLLPETRTYKLILSASNIGKYTRTLAIGTESAALLKATKNGVELKSLRDVKPGDTIKIQGSYYGGLPGAVLIGKLQKGERDFEVHTLVGFENGKQTEEVEFTIGEEEITAIEVYLWESLDTVVPLYGRRFIE